MTQSKYQLAFYDAVRNTNSSLLIEAVAGSGKTSSIVQAASFLPLTSRILFLAFNVAIVEELKSRLPQHVNCCTFNSIGYKAWRAFVGKKFIKVDANKTMNIVREFLSKDDQNIYGSFIVRMVGLAKSSGLGGYLLDDTPENWESLRDHHNVIINHSNKNEEMEADYSRGLFLACKTLQESCNRARDIIDFDDQIYMPYLRCARFEQYNVVFIDELQDLNEVQHSLLKRMLVVGGRVIGVGDSRQAIYGFRGSDHNSMENFAREFSCVRLPLSISYRCSKSIIREAQKYMPTIEAFENAAEGIVERLTEYNPTTFQIQDAIICRNTAPLVAMAYGFISRGQSVNMPGRDFSKGLQKLILDMRANNLEELSDKLEKWFSKQSERYLAKNQESKIESLKDRLDTIEIIIDNLGVNKNSIKDLLDEIEYIFSGGKTNSITLMTSHKSKGREFDRVFILDFHLMPSKYAKNKAWMMGQENNLIYVTITRARKYLGYINSKCWMDSHSMAVPR